MYYRSQWHKSTGIPRHHLEKAVEIRFKVSCNVQENWLHNDIKAQALEDHVDIKMFCGCCSGCRRASPHAPSPLQNHRVATHHT